MNTKKVRTRIELNKTDKKQCGQLDLLCQAYREADELQKKYKAQVETVKENIKSRLDLDADYITTQYKIVISITPPKTEFKYDIEKILKVYPELRENVAFGKFETKDEVKTLKRIDKLEENKKG